MHDDILLMSHDIMVNDLATYIYTNVTMSSPYN